MCGIGAALDACEVCGVGGVLEVSDVCVASARAGCL